jgi:hypothetical protein
MPSAETPHETWIRLVRLALGRNLATGAPPPFEFVRAMETIGVETLAPDLSTPAETLDSLLADVVDQDDAAAIRIAHESVIDCDAVENWFEAGEAVENVLRPTDTVEAGAQALLEGYLPGRRAFWASQCALTALALREASPLEPWRELALVGRDILRDKALTDVPLMSQIAERSAMSLFVSDQ